MLKGQDMISSSDATSNKKPLVHGAWQKGNEDHKSVIVNQLQSQKWAMWG